MKRMTRKQRGQRMMAGFWATVFFLFSVALPTAALDESTTYAFAYHGKITGGTRVDRESEEGVALAKTLQDNRISITMNIPDEVQGKVSISVSVRSSPMGRTLQLWQDDVDTDQYVNVVAEGSIGPAEGMLAEEARTQNYYVAGDVGEYRVTFTAFEKRASGDTILTQQKLFFRITDLGLTLTPADSQDTLLPGLLPPQEVPSQLDHLLPCNYTLSSTEGCPNPVRIKLSAQTDRDASVQLWYQEENGEWRDVSMSGVVGPDSFECQTGYQGGGTVYLTADKNCCVTLRIELEDTVTGRCLTSHTASLDANVLVPVQTVVLDKVSATIPCGQQLQLHAQILPQDATLQELSWSSSAPSVAEVDSYGCVTAKELGQAVVTVTAGGVSAACTVTVTEKEMPEKEGGLTLDKTALTLQVGDTSKLTATVFGAAENEKVSWTTSDASIVTVGQDGQLEAKKAGEAVITVAAGNWKASCTVTVTEKETPEKEGGLTLDKTALTLQVGDTSKLTATVFGAAENEKVSWTTSDASIVTVEQDGQVKAKRAGKAVITVTAGSWKASCTVTVTDSPAMTQGEDGLGYAVGAFLCSCVCFLVHLYRKRCEG